MKIFLAGVMQGNKKELGIYSQNYRKQLTEIVTRVIPDAEIVDPDITDPDRLSYTMEQSADMFFRYCDTAGKVDLLISYVPEASMGSAIEMWKAYTSKIPVITISEMDHNWVVKLLSSKIYPDIDSFKKNFTKVLLEELNLV